MDPLSSLLAGAPPASRPGPGEAPPDDEKARADDALWDIRSQARIAAMLAGASQADAEDAAQDAIIALWQAAARGDLPAKPSAYTWMVARRRAMRYRHGPDIPVDDSDLDALASPADWVSELVSQEQVRSWLRGLPRKERDVIALVIDGYWLGEIAEVLKIPPRAARRRAHDARQRLRMAIAAQAEEERAAELAGQPTPKPRATRARHPQDSQARPGDDELRALPPRQREVLRLSREGYKPAQIAKALSLSPNTVRVNLCHARKRVHRNRELLSSPAA